MQHFAHEPIAQNIKSYRAMAALDRQYDRADIRADIGGFVFLSSCG
jgi:hypothetical protein